jgi:hypothetical protein
MKLLDAYHVLGLEPGSSIESIRRRYRRLIMVWHPDRAPSAEDRRFAEEELKKINNGKDLLERHFRDEHIVASSCACQSHDGHDTTGADKDDSSRSGSDSGSGSGSGPGPGYHRYKPGGANKQQSERAKGDAAPPRTEPPPASQSKSDESVRWKVAAACAAVFLLLLLFAPHNEDNQKSDSSTSAPATLQVPLTSTQPPVQRERDEGLLRGQRQREQERTDLDDKIYFCKLEIDRHQKSIDRNRELLTDLDARLASQLIVESERQKLEELRQFRADDLRKEQSDLASAEANLQSLTERRQNLQATSP